MTVYNFVALSAASFYGVKLFAKHVIAEKYLKSTDYRQVWLWRNTFCSLVHSFLTAPWTMYWYEFLYIVVWEWLWSLNSSEFCHGIWSRAEPMFSCFCNLFIVSVKYRHCNPRNGSDLGKIKTTVIIPTIVQPLLVSF